ncbi:MAG: hypothetical protein K6T31_00300, partial [Alicyclobacillus sp.]|nr:hypothetical protein [Alicyclobacillus sp.]
LLFSLFHSDALGPRRSNARAIVFNVKGEDLLWLDKPNRRLGREEREKYEALGLPAEPFASVRLWAPVRRDAPEAVPDTGSRQSDVTPYYWTLREFCEQRLLRFLFADADTEASQIAFAVMQVERALEEAARATPPEAGYLELEGTRFMRFGDLAEFVAVNQEMFTKNIAQATYNAFARRLEAAAATCGHLFRADRQEVANRHRIDWLGSQVSVIDLHNLHDRAKRFVVGVVVKRLMEEKERTGTAEPLVFLVLDELNKYAPREGWSPIKEVVLDIAERGRSLGVVLIGAEQTASEIERRVTANASFRVVGRLDAAEAQRTIIDPVRIRQQLEEIRRTGYAVTHEESTPGLCSVAVPVYDDAGGVIAAISVTGSHSEFLPGQVHEYLRQMNKYSRLITEKLEMCL